MATRKPIKWMSVFLGIIGLFLFSGAYVALTLFGLSVTPVAYEAPRKLVF